MRTTIARLIAALAIPFLAALVVPLSGSHHSRSAAAPASQLHSSEINIHEVALASPAAQPRLGGFVRASRSSRRGATRWRPLTAGEVRGGVASWYNDRPSRCFDRAGSHPVPRGTTIWTAAHGLPCGTMVDVRGPAGLVRVPVYDQGPAVSGRDLDLSLAAFRQACGTSSRGICWVSYGLSR